MAVRSVRVTTKASGMPPLSLFVIFECQMDPVQQVNYTVHHSAILSRESQTPGRVRFKFP